MVETVNPLARILEGLALQIMLVANAFMGYIFTFTVPWVRPKAAAVTTVVPAVLPDLKAMTATPLTGV